MAIAAPAPKRILLVHAVDDCDAAQRLKRHLGVPRRKDLLVTTVDDIPPGAPWREEMDRLVDEADLVVALLSSDLLSSDLWDHELSRIRERRPALRLAPVLARSVSLEGTIFDAGQVAPRSGIPVAAHALADEVWTEIARELRGLLTELPPSPRPPPPPPIAREDRTSQHKQGKRPAPPAQSSQAQAEPPLGPEPALTRQLPDAAQQGTLAGPALAIGRGAPESRSRAAAAANPGAAVPPARGAGAPAAGRPTKASLRKLIAEVLRVSAQLDAFCIDYFPEVAGEFTGGMSRTEKVNLLLQLRKPAEVLQQLRLDHPAAVERHEELIEYE
ncbi:TIR domain-containing protein [Sorangium sp. So ce1389]|uniref:TIR domain-containing protein n=1 Tax=Sorangium sp. So ce1389 TaxID=3133336 RepID=UPI003F6200E1